MIDGTQIRAVRESTRAESHFSATEMLECSGISGRLCRCVFDGILPAYVESPLLGVTNWNRGEFPGKAGVVGQVAAGGGLPFVGKTTLATVGLHFTAQGRSFVFIICFGLLGGINFLKMLHRYGFCTVKLTL